MLKKIRNILCVRLDSLGDVLMTTPAFFALHQHVPDARITLLTSPAGAGLADYLPGIDECMVHNAPWIKSSQETDPEEYVRMVEILRQKQFDIAFIFTVYSQNPLPSAMMCLQARIPERIAHCRENPYAMLTHWIKDLEPFSYVRHEVERQLNLVRAYGCEVTHQNMRLELDAFVCESTERTLNLLGLPSRQPYVVVHPGASASSRRYQLDGFIEIVRRLMEDTHLPIVITGSPDEAAWGHALCEATSRNVFNAIGALNTAEFAATVKNAHLVISNNTSTVHIASACGTPVVDIYSLTNPQHTPWMVPSRVIFEPMPCGFCYRSECPRGDNACINRVSPESIVTVAKDLLQEVAANREHTDGKCAFPSYARNVIHLADANVNPFLRRTPETSPRIESRVLPSPTVSQPPRAS